jgi:hypothetical protein
MQIKQKSQTSEADAVTLACIAKDYHEFEPILKTTPLDLLLEKEERTALENVGVRESRAIRSEALSAFLAYCFSPVNNTKATVFDALQKLWLICYCIRPDLIDGMSLEKIGKMFGGESRQTLSKRVLKINKEINMRSRNQKSDTSVSIYRAGTKAWHQERKTKEKAERRKAYVKAWKAANAAEVKAYQQAYREKNRERLNAAKRAKRKAGK